MLFESFSHKPLLHLHNLIKGCISNNAQCQRQIYERYYSYAFKIAFRYIYRYGCVADVVNDGFVQMFRNINTFAGINEIDIEPRLMGWIKKIVINTAIHALGKNKKCFETDEIPDGIWEEPHNGKSVDAYSLYKKLICQLKKLPTVNAVVFNLYVIDGFSHQEIAAQLGISIGTSKSNLFKAKAALRKVVDWEPTPIDSKELPDCAWKVKGTGHQPEFQCS